MKISHYGTESDVPFGSGVLWVPPASNAGTSYVFTAAHLFNEKDMCNPDQYRAHWLCEEDRQELVLPVAQIFLPDRQDGALDLAVLQLNLSAYPQLRTPYQILTNEALCQWLRYHSSTPSLFGYPRQRYEKPFPHQHLKVECKFGEHTKVARESGLFSVTIPMGRISEYNLNVEMEGMSGGGLFIRVGDVDVLCGIHSGSNGDDSTYREVWLTAIDGVLDILQTHNLPQPQQMSCMPADLTICKAAMEERLCSADGERNPIVPWVGKLLRLSPQKVIEASCMASETCTMQHYFYACPRFQEQYLLGCGLLSYHNEAIPIECLNVKLDEDNLRPAHIVCYDISGRRAKEMANALVREIQQDKLGKLKIMDGSLVLWATKKGVHGRCVAVKKDEFNKIVGDISAVSDPLGCSYTEIDAAPKDVTVANIGGVVDALDEDPTYFQTEIVDQL